MKDKLREELRDKIAKAIADAIGHGMREKCERHADAVLAILDAEGDGGAVAWQDKVNEIANNIGESLNAGCDQDAVDRINVYVDELFALATNPARSGVVSDEDVRDAARYRWLRSANADDYVPYIAIEKTNDWGKTASCWLQEDEADQAIDAAIQGKHHER